VVEWEPETEQLYTKCTEPSSGDSRLKWLFIWESVDLEP